jgi:hypothetical protein
MTFVDRKKQIDDKYYKEVQAISSNADDKEMAAHLAALRQAHEQETTDLQNNLLRQSALYQQLNEDIISFTRDQLKKRIDLLKKELKDGFVIDLKTGIKTDIELTPQMRADVQSQVDSSENLVANTDKTVVNLNKIATEANGVGSAFNDLASAVSGINQSLADSLQLIGNIVNGVGKAASSLSAFKQAQAKGNTAEGIAGQITAGIGIASAVIGVVSGVLNFFKAAHDSRVQAQKELEQYQNSIINGEVSYNELLRERARTQGDITNMTIAELQARQQLLQTQKQQAEADYNRLLQQIQNAGQQITGETTQKTGGFLGIGRKTEVVQQLAGLSSTDFDQLEKLFTEGKLDQTTAAWFQELQKVHDELDSIGQSADDVKNQLEQVLTGTTSDAIAQSIADGLSQGYNSFADFSDDINKLLVNAIMSAFTAQQIKPAAQQLFDLLATYNQDGIITQDEVDKFKDASADTISKITQQFDQLKQLSSLDFTGNSSNTNSLQGAIKGMTEQTAELWAGQMGAQRMTMVEHVTSCFTAVESIGTDY